MFPNSVELYTPSWFLTPTYKSRNFLWNHLALLLCCNKGNFWHEFTSWMCTCMSPHLSYASVVPALCSGQTAFPVCGSSLWSDLQHPGLHKGAGPLLLNCGHSGNPHCGVSKQSPEGAFCPFVNANTSKLYVDSQPAEVCVCTCVCI